MVNNGVAPQVGPGRAWVAWARELASRGLGIIRADLTGLGDSGSQDGPTPESYPATAGRDLRSLAHEARSVGADQVALVGLCSGALLALDGLKAGAPVDAVIAINPRFDRAWVDSPRDRTTRAARQTNRLLAIPLRKSPLFGFFDRVPAPVWWFLDAMHLVASPSVALRQVTEGRARLLMVFGPREWGWSALRRRARNLDTMLAHERITVRHVAGLDHSMFAPDARDATFAIVQDYLRDELGWMLPRDSADTSARQQGTTESEDLGAPSGAQQGLDRPE
jgi:hypothetical protein